MHQNSEVLCEAETKLSLKVDIKTLQELVKIAGSPGRSKQILQLFKKRIARLNLVCHLKVRKMLKYLSLRQYVIHCI